MKTEIRTDLLRKLADHLLNGKLGHEKFRFSVINVDEFGRMMTEPNSCGTLGCAMGELPILFPEDWVFDYSTIKRLNFDLDDIYDVTDYFRISEDQEYHLFYPTLQNEKWGPILEAKSTKEEVAANIIKFCELAEGGLL